MFKFNEIPTKYGNTGAVQFQLWYDKHVKNIEEIHKK